MPKRSLVISTRVVAGTIGVIVAAATIAAAGLLDLPTIVRQPESVSVTPVPTAKQLICPGSVLQLGNSGGENASTASPLGQPSITRAATTGSVDSTVLTAADAEATSGTPTLLTVPAASGGAPIGIAGAQHQEVDEGDYRGLAAAECAQPSSDSWLLAGSTATGRTTLLSLVNPGSLASTIAIELFTADGPVEAAGTTGIVVGAGSQRVISLAGFAPGVKELAVHVVSRGGPVAATLQESIVRGIEASGVDIVAPTAPPSTVNVIPGVLILGADAVAGRLGEEGFEDLGTALRVFVPGDTPAQATVRVVPADAELAEDSENETPLVGASFDLSLDPGVVTDIPIEGLADGAYSVQVESTVAILASVRASTVADKKVGSTSAGASDVAWFGAATALTGSAFASIAPGPGASLHLSNPGDQAVVVTVGGQTVTVDAGATVTVEVTDSESYQFENAAGLYASISFAAPGQLASYLVSSASNDESPVVIFTN